MKRKLLTAAEIVIFTAAVTGMIVFGGQPGGEDDPIVSKSYVDSKIEQLKGNSREQSGISDDVKNEIIQEVLMQTGSGDMYVPVFVKKGEVLYGAEGSEIILRSGVAYAKIEGGDGIVNATEGTELPDTYPIRKNNLHIVPRDDGRGMRVTEDAWFIVKGGYRVE
ncbi:MAG: hypothetical protein IJ736_13840 [Firmicutes bacterium]|nr:hypothetical protein [Bacillota bacterium]